MSKLKVVFCVVLVLLAVGAVAVRLLVPPRYTAKAVLQLALCQPHILPSAAEKYDPVEFESFRDTQAALSRPAGS